MMRDEHTKTYDLGGLSEDLLCEGRSVIVKVEGFSMYPNIRPGDRVKVAPLSDQEILRKGSIVCFKMNEKYVLHRIITISEDGSVSTRGDFYKTDDPILHKDDIIGIAISSKRGAKQKEKKLAKKSMLLIALFRPWWKLSWRIC